MDLRKRASLIFILIYAGICVAASWFFTMIGSNLGELGMKPLLKWSNLIWVIWGIAWGAICGVIGGYLSVKTLIDKRKISGGIKYGVMTGLFIGAVNGFLTNTIIFGIVEGLVLGAFGGLILSAVFLGFYRD